MHKVRYNSIEMIGLSGVGKTTLFHNTDSTIFKDLFEHSSVHPIKPSKISFFFETLVLIVKVVIGVVFSISLSSFLSRNHINLYMKLGYRIASIKMRNLSGLVYLRDSGVLMPLLSSVIDDRLRIDNTLLFEILSNAPLPKHVYCMIDSPNNIYNRFISREKKLGNDIKNYSLSDFQNANTFLFELIKILRKKSVNVTVINNKGCTL